MGKTNKELTIEFAIEYIKSWNSADHTKAINTNQALDILKVTYDTISGFDNHEK